MLIERFRLIHDDQIALFFMKFHQKKIGNSEIASYPIIVKKPTPLFPRKGWSEGNFAVCMKFAHAEERSNLNFPSESSTSIAVVNNS